MTEMSLLVSFPDQSETFMLGFEAGMIWQEMEGGALSIDRGFESGTPIHAGNLEVIVRMAAARGYAVEKSGDADGWVPVRLTFAGRAKPALRVVT